MKTSFQQAKNGELTAIINNLYIHSSYNPSGEALRFVNNIKTENSPALILILEPGISYIVPLLKERFKNAKIGIIRYTPDFNKFNNNADYIFNYYEHENDFENYLFYQLGEELFFGALILQWQPSSRVFSQIDNKVILIIKSLMEKSKTLLITREFFEKKWIINSCNFIKYTNTPVLLNKKIKIPVVIISSGPSLKDSINIIKQHKEKIFIICLSSAIKVCLANNIVPDLCISTDGGFWAGEHLKALQQNNISLALPLEAFCPKKILQNNFILPLVYNDGISKSIADKSDIPNMKAERNGTVSGTALIFAENISDNNIYFCGLDMSNQTGFQHCQPNELELNNSLKDYKLRTKEQRLSQAEYSEGVLSIYKEWFDYIDLQKRNIYRIIQPPYKKNTLGKIKDITSKEFETKLSQAKAEKQDNYFTKAGWNRDLQQLKTYLKTFSATETWKKNIFPLSMTSLRHNPNNTDIINRLDKEEKQLNKKIENILDEQ